MVLHHLDKEKGILRLEPKGKLESQDFESIETEVTRFLRDNGKLKGLMVKTEEFPGWSDLEALFAHLDFVKTNHNKVERVAVVSDDSLMQTGAPAVNLIIDAEMKTFELSDESVAEEWLKAA